MKNILVINVIPSGVGGIQTYGKTLEEKIKSMGISVIRIETYTVNTKSNLLPQILRKILRVFTNLIKLFKTLEENKSNKKIIIHAHIAKQISFWENSIYALFGNLLGVSFIFHIHSSLLHIEYLNSKPIVKKIRRYILNKSSKIIALSDYWRNKLLEIKDIPEEKFITVYNFVDIEKFNRYEKETCRRKLNLSKNRKIIFSIGRMTERKGFQYLIEAIPKVIKAREDVLFVIGGKGSMKEKLEKKTQEYKMDEYVRFIGFVPDELLPIWLNACDIFVLPSLRETFPIVMLEALASGKPVVGTKIAAMPEVISSEDYGLLVEPANPEDLAEKILIALEKKWDREKIRRYAERFTWGNIAMHITKIYKGLVTE